MAARLPNQTFSLMGKTRLLMIMMLCCRQLQPWMAKLPCLPWIARSVNCLEPFRHIPVSNDVTVSVMPISSSQYLTEQSHKREHNCHGNSGHVCWIRNLSLVGLTFIYSAGEQKPERGAKHTFCGRCATSGGPESDQIIFHHTPTSR